MGIVVETWAAIVVAIEVDMKEIVAAVGVILAGNGRDRMGDNNDDKCRGHGGGGRDFGGQGCGQARNDDSRPSTKS